MATASLVGIVVGGLLFAAGLVDSRAWLVALGLVLVPVSMVVGLRGGGRGGAAGQPEAGQQESAEPTPPGGRTGVEPPGSTSG